MDACTKETTLVDAWEFSYAYKERKQFEQAYETITKKVVDMTALLPDKYKDHVQAGFGIWMDHGRNGWDPSNFSKNFFTPAELESAVNSALEVSDGYVWIYTERPKWWPNEMLPVEYVKALANARKQEKKD